MATARAVREINTHVARVDGALTRVARELAGRVEVQDGLTGDRPAVRTVFDLLRATDGDQPFSDLAITLYDARLVPRAWHGRPAELSPERLQSGATGFADVGPAELRLVHVEPIVESTLEPGARARRLGTVVVERVISSTRATADPDRGFVARTSVGRAVLHPGEDGGGDPRVYRFDAAGTDGSARVGVSISLDEIDRVRARWRRRVAALFLVVLAGTTLAAGGRALAGRARLGHLRPAVVAAAATVAAGGGLWLASSPGLFAWSLLSPAAYRSLQAPQVLRTAADLLLAAAVAAVLVVLAGEERQPPTVVQTSPAIRRRERAPVPAAGNAAAHDRAARAPPPAPAGHGGERVDGHPLHVPATVRRGPEPLCSSHWCWRARRRYGPRHC